MQWVPCCVICCIPFTTGADTEVQNNTGWTPLMYACSEGHKDVVAHLLEHGAQADVHSLYYAISNHHHDVSLPKLLIAVSYTHLTLPTIYSV